MDGYNFEDILELAHAEKHTADLQPLVMSQLAKINAYLDLKKSLLEKTANKDLRFKLQMELENAQRAVNDLYGKREMKIIHRAIYAARSQYKLKDTTNMFPKEELFYNQLIELLSSSQNNFYSALKSTKSAIMQEVPKPLKAAHKTLKFKEAVPELLDMKENRHGPFQPNDEAELPEELANVLVAQNKAVIVDKNNENTEANKEILS